jgi:hypothetical protein
MQAADNKLIVYAANDSARLRYVLDWIFNERLGVAYSLATEETELKDIPFFIAYGKDPGKGLSMPDAGLLWQRGSEKHEIKTGEWEGIPTLYHSSEGSFTLPFDILSAVFFLLSRHEEYYDYTPDKHGRYPATESILFKNNWLRRPIVDEWIAALGKLLSEKYGIKVYPPPFSFIPSYDIDIAFSYLHKGRRRTIGGFFRDLLKGDIDAIMERSAVARGRQQDPYDSFDMMAHWHKEFGYNPRFFVLASLQTTDFDKNIHPSHPHMRKLVKQMDEQGEVGMHPSYYTDKFPEYWHNERAALKDILDKNINISRQHYIRLQIPETYHFLEQNGIKDDYSMGYGSHLGFRAGTGAAFNFYHLPEEKAKYIRIHPFCFMDTTARFEEKMNCQQAFSVLEEMKKLLQRCNSQLITIFHNFSLGSARDWTGWKKSYRDFIER